MDHNDDDNEDKLHEGTEDEEAFEEEFDFEEEHEDALAPDELGEDARSEELEEPPKRKNSLLPIIIGGLVVGFLGFKGYKMVSAPKEISPEVVKEAPKVIASKPVEIKPAPQPIVAQLPSEDLLKLQKKSDEQDQVQKQQIQHLSVLEKNLTTAMQNTVDANKSMTVLQHDVAALSSALQDLALQVKVIREDQIAALAKLEEQARRKAEKAKSAKALKPEAVSSPTLTVHAIIPGRAWLRTLEGKTITVTEGDLAGEYGKVLKIDAPNGVVVTSSGVVLR